MFKKSSKKQGAIRKRKISDETGNEPGNDDSHDGNEKLQKAKLKRELLKKHAGVSAAALAKGKKITRKEQLTDDPYKMSSGGGLTVVGGYGPTRRIGTGTKETNRVNRDRMDDGRNVANISDTFKAEKKIRDEEEEMNKYIESELMKRRGIEKAGEKISTFERKKLHEILDPKSLYHLPERFMPKSKVHREDGLLSAQMLNGIPEVDLGVTTKILNIERTEAAKRIMVDKFIKDELKNANDHTEKNAMANDKKIVRGGQEFTDQFYSQHMRFWKGNEPDSDSKEKFRSHIGEWKTVDKAGVYGDAKELGGLHGDDISVTSAGEEKTDLYKRFAEAQGANHNVDTTGHRV